MAARRGYVHLRGAVRIKTRRELYISLWGLRRGIGVITGAPQWVLNSMLGQPDYYSWLGLLIERFPAFIAELEPLDVNTRMIRMKDQLKAWGDEYRRLTPEAKRTYAERAEAAMREATGPLREQVAIIMEILGVIGARVPPIAPGIGAT